MDTLKKIEEILNNINDPDHPCTVEIEKEKSLQLTKDIKQKTLQEDSSRRIKNAKTFNDILCALVPLHRYYQNIYTKSNLSISTKDSHKKKSNNKINIDIILEDIRSAHNVGSIIRTFECINARNIYLCGYTPSPKETKVKKTSLKTEEQVSWQKQFDIKKVIQQLKKDNTKIIGVETVIDSQDIFTDTQDPKTSIALVFGNEKNGISPQTLELCDHIIKIPVFGNKNSLNVSVALGIVIYHYGYKKQLTSRHNL
jgi:23S rRNA (guanosine2251-2'-O)-methyltransferase